MNHPTEAVSADPAEAAGPRRVKVNGTGNG